MPSFPPSPADDFGQLRLDRQVVGAVREHDRVLAGTAQHVAEPPDDPSHALLRVAVPRQARKVVVVRKHLARDDLGRSGAPAEHDADVVDFVTHAAGEQERADPEAGEDLRQLGRVAEAVGHVAGAARLDAEAAADSPAEQEVPDERLAPDEDLVRQDVRRPGLETSCREQRPQPRLVLRPNVDVVLEHDRLAVERERRERGVALERVEDTVDDRAEPQPEDLERDVPLAIPVGVGDDEEAEIRRLHGQLAIRSERMRFATVLFDLDGTVVDSGAIILASMRHATREVLGREYTDEELLQASAGRASRRRCRRSRRTASSELVDVYRAHNVPLHDALEACAGMEDVLVRLHEEGRRLGVVTAKRRSTVELAFASVPLGHLFETVVGGDETERHKPDPEPLLLGASASARTPQRRPMSATRRSTSSRRRRPACSRSPSRGDGSTTARGSRRRSRTRSSTPPRSSLPSSKTRAAGAPRSCARS